jgi:8-oxo-dGTP pyrophosphatase MutT (NUDIX family)
MTVKHATASVFVFSLFADGWRLGLIEHPRLGRLMIPGGHVEDDESQAAAALREVMEESGLRVRLVDAPAAPLPAGFPHPRVASPWWITEQSVPPDNHLPEPHVHVDHQYVAVADDRNLVAEPAHPFGWYGADQVGDLPMFEDSKLLAKMLFASVDNPTGPFLAATSAQR